MYTQTILFAELTHKLFSVRLTYHLRLVWNFLNKAFSLCLANVEVQGRRKVYANDEKKC